jgi:hypothetical protein
MTSSGLETLQDLSEDEQVKYMEACVKSDYKVGIGTGYCGGEEDKDGYDFLLTVIQKDEDFWAEALTAAWMAYSRSPLENTFMVKKLGHIVDYKRKHGIGSDKDESNNKILVDMMEYAKKNVPALDEMEVDEDLDPVELWGGDKREKDIRKELWGSQ